MNSKALFFACWICALSLYSQSDSSIALRILDQVSEQPVANAHVRINAKLTTTDSRGYCQVNASLGSQCNISISHLNYQTLHYPAYQFKHATQTLLLTPIKNVLDEVQINKRTSKLSQRIGATTIRLDSTFMARNRGNSLAQSLASIAGVNVMTIGATQAKPSIRGLGFNRLVVSENGIKHEAQQWGADHGLEMDQYAVDQIEVVKGAASLSFGSDAIAGVIQVKNNKIPAVGERKNDLQLNYQSNNHLLGISAGITQRYTKWFFKTRITHQDYRDYRVPTDKINYDNYVFNLYRQQLRNTAGFSHNAIAVLGYSSDSFNSITTLSNVNEKNGFFANAHGLEVRTSKIDYDKSNNDISLPFHKVNHFKINHQNSFFFDNSTVEINLGFQRNDREEHSEPVPHGYMPTPPNSLERKFKKTTYNATFKHKFHNIAGHRITYGIDGEYQDNQIGGWGFLIPNYQRTVLGAYIFDVYKPSKTWQFDGGIRYDYGRVKTEAYREWFPSPLGNGNSGVSYRKRSENKTLNFSSFSAALGAQYHIRSWKINLQLGKSFRIPLAHELASNGVNYHMYRFEVGNLQLRPESSYQLDANIQWKTSKLRWELSPFLNYFDNFIYLTPTTSYYETLQRYQYTQSSVFRYGGEFTVRYDIHPSLTVNASAEYLKARQLNGPKKNFSLPFTPPFTARLGIQYQPQHFATQQQLTLFANTVFTADQNEIVPPEKPTPGYQLVHLGASAAFKIVSKKHPTRVQLNVNNVFDAKVFNHTSFYRLIEVPEPGRNYSIRIIQSF